MSWCSRSRRRTSGNPRRPERGWPELWKYRRQLGSYLWSISGGKLDRCPAPVHLCACRRRPARTSRRTLPVGPEMSWCSRSRRRTSGNPRRPERGWPELWKYRRQLGSYLWSISGGKLDRCPAPVHLCACRRRPARTSRRTLPVGPEMSWCSRSRRRTSGNPRRPERGWPELWKYRRQLGSYLWSKSRISSETGNPTLDHVA